MVHADRASRSVVGEADRFTFHDSVRVGYTTAADRPVPKAGEGFEMDSGIPSLQRCAEPDDLKIEEDVMA